MKTPYSSTDFDRAYRLPITFWGDIRIPDEIKALAARGRPERALELGCGVGRFSRWVAQQGIRATGIDFSPVAIDKARARVEDDGGKPEFLVGDVTKLDALTGPYDFSFDVGCFHCLDEKGQRAYASEVFRLLKPGGIHLIWALDHSPSDMSFSPDLVRTVFEPQFLLQDARKSRRRIIRSHWYWLERAARA